MIKCDPETGVCTNDMFDELSVELDKSNDLAEISKTAKPYDL